MEEEMDTGSNKAEDSLQDIAESIELPDDTNGSAAAEQDSNTEAAVLEHKTDTQGDPNEHVYADTQGGSCDEISVVANTQGAPNEFTVPMVEIASADQLEIPTTEGSKWKALPIAITVDEEVEDGTSVPTKLLIYPGNIASSGDQEVQQVSEITNDDTSIANHPTGDETDDYVPTILFHLQQQDASDKPRRPSKNKEDAASSSPTPDKDDNIGSAFPCNLCEFVAKHRHDLKTHMLVHTKPTIKEYFKCAECDYATPLKHNLKTHMKKHAKLQDLSENDIYRCKDCDYVSAYKHDLQTHVMKHASEKPYKCDECEFSSIYRHSVIHHKASKHNKERPYKCAECSYSSARKQDLQVHMGKHSTEKPFQCTLCDYGTPFRQSFKAHMNRHLGHKSFKCNLPDCDFATTTRQNLKSHMTRHESVKQYRCQYCDYTASHKTQLVNHEGKHAGDSKVKVQKKFTCSSCDYVTAHKYSMKRHKERHSENRTMPEKIFHCSQCVYQTGYKSSLKRHIAKHSEVKPFRCGHCEYSAVNMTQMHVHIAKHTGIKPFKCNECDYSTANKQHLVGHMAKHSDVKLKCPLCDFSTAWRQRLSIHIKQHERSAAMHMPRQSLYHQNRAKGPIEEPQLEESVQQLYQIEQNETNEALSQLSNVIAAYQEQLQDSSASGSGSQTPSEGAPEQSSNTDIQLSEVGGDQVLLIPNMETSQTQVVIVDGAGQQISPHNHEQVQFIIDAHNKPMLETALQKIVTTDPQTTAITSTEVGIDVSALHSQVVSADGEQIGDIIADGEHTLIVEGEQTLVANEKGEFHEQDIGAGHESMEIVTSEVVDSDMITTEQVLESSDLEQTLAASVELSSSGQTEGERTTES